MSTLIHQDTIITQLKNGLPGKLLMYGDDTWLNLFPDTFDRFDGTSSFFVSVCSTYLKALGRLLIRILGLYRSGQ